MSFGGRPLLKPFLIILSGLSSAKYTMILLLPLLCVATKTETLAREPNRQDKKAQPCWIDQPDLLYS